MKKEEEKIRKKEENKIMKKEEEKIMKKEEKKTMKKEENKIMKKEENKMKELVKEIEAKRMLLIEKVIKWCQSLNPIKDLHLKEKGRFYPLIGKETGKLYVIDKVEGKKIPFNTLEDRKMMYVICTTLAERNEEIKKEVQEEKRKYLEKKLEEVEDLLNKF